METGSGQFSRFSSHTMLSAATSDHPTTGPASNAQIGADGVGAAVSGKRKQQGKGTRADAEELKRRVQRAKDVIKEADLESWKALLTEWQEDLEDQEDELARWEEELEARESALAQGTVSILDFLSCSLSEMISKTYGRTSIISLSLVPSSSLSHMCVCVCVLVRVCTYVVCDPVHVCDYVRAVIRPKVLDGGRKDDVCLCVVCRARG